MGMPARTLGRCTALGSSPHDRLLAFRIGHGFLAFELLLAGEKLDGLVGGVLEGFEDALHSGAQVPSSRLHESYALGLSGASAHPGKILSHGVV
jgi:hypothetical protein